MFSQVCNHYYITLFITITSDVLIKIFKNLIIFLVCGFQGTYLTDSFISHQKSQMSFYLHLKSLITGKFSFSFFDLAPTCSPTPSPVEVERLHNKRLYIENYILKYLEINVCIKTNMPISRHPRRIERCEERMRNHSRVNTSNASYKLRTTQTDQLLQRYATE